MFVTDTVQPHHQIFQFAKHAKSLIVIILQLKSIGLGLKQNTEIQNNLEKSIEIHI